MGVFYWYIPNCIILKTINLTHGSLKSRVNKVLFSIICIDFSPHFDIYAINPRSVVQSQSISAKVMKKNSYLA